MFVHFADPWLQECGVCPLSAKFRYKGQCHEFCPPGTVNEVLPAFTINDGTRPITDIFTCIDAPLPKTE